MSSRRLEVAGPLSTTWRFAAPPDRPAITWWPTSLPGSDLDDRPRRRRRPAPRIRRGRIQLVLG